ncbi:MULTISPECIES: vWA domain-containing protein [unclassified Modestobacter]|uniref:vWA domain-containing protein n=1 Tax=unclassified Modestobacter TaxID=2643866 RepID=UPI0022AA63F2|nr:MULTISPECIES: vWA domain-containing protein [unclassified Modestobacter]MCZ2826062.1 VWA domain-containing protein [Modestobacter sp. VKM Ac-2981]MCZ2852873.1 VWA domain-containing protein [Modestobacter sp. VKM Ac-2982]
MTTWIRRSFDAPGLTQYPTGRHLEAVQSQFSGSVVLCLDVSGSMSGSPLSQAVQGCRRFVDEALQALYEVAVLFWDHGVVGYTLLTRDQGRLHAFLDRASIHGGTNVVPALHEAHALLTGQKGDRVVAIFGDGDLGDAAGARRKSDAMRADNIRIITCGLGLASAESLDVISTETTAAGPRVADVNDIADSIAGMAGGLRRTGRR